VTGGRRRNADRGEDFAGLQRGEIGTLIKVARRDPSLARFAADLIVQFRRIYVIAALRRTSEKKRPLRPITKPSAIGATLSSRWVQANARFPTPELTSSPIHRFEASDAV